MRVYFSKRFFLSPIAFALFAIPGPTTAQVANPAGQPQAPASQPSVATASSPVATPTVFGEITGIVKAGSLALPGVTVTAANTLTGKKYITSTDIDGTFKIAVGGKGRYVVRAEFSAFAPVTQEIILNEQNPTGKADLSMVLLSRAQQAEQQQQRQQIAQQIAAAAGGRPGMQQLSLTAGEEGAGAGGASNDTASLTGAGLPSAGLAAESSESVAVSGNMGRSEQNAFDPGEMQDRIAELREQSQQGGGTGTINLNGGTANIQILGGGGGFGGGGFGGGGGGFGGAGGGPMVIMMGGGPGGGGRGMRGFNVNKPHGSIFYSYGGSILDAKPYSLQGAPEEKADYNQSRFGFTIGGPLNIPHIYHGGTKTFLFGNYSGARGTSAYDVFSAVPSLRERSGNFSASNVQLFDPVTHAPIPGNVLSSINPAAAQLLNFIPQPNLPGDSRNFHFVSATPSSSDTMFIRFNHRFGDQAAGAGGRGIRQQQRQQQRQGQNQQKSSTKWSQSINGGFVFNDLRNTVLNPFPGLGGKQTVHNMNVNAGYSAVKGLFLNSLRFTYNRNNIHGANNFTNVNNIEGQLGITGVSQLPADYGLPVLNFLPAFSSLRDMTPVFRTNQTFVIADSMSLTHGKHSWTWGGDFRRILADTRNAGNARGTFTFTGAATGQFGADQRLVPFTGSPLADFLLGFAQQTSIQFGAEDYQFRANSWDLFVQDNWRAAKNLTLNLGLRYENVTPYVEINNQLANLDVAPDFSAVAVVLPGQIGPITGRKFPDSLIKPDRNNFAPRVGLAWKPFSKTVVRAGYGINYNLAQYGLMSTQLGFQPPFANAQINSLLPTQALTGLTLQNGFPFTAADPSHITNTYAVDPDYKLAYVQSWNLNIQQEVKSSVVINIGYTGSKGTHLDMVRAPDQKATGLPLYTSCTPVPPPGVSCVSPFLFESSQGSSTMHAGTLRVRKRMRRGLSVGGAYTYSKSIDNASSIGGGAVVVAQNDLDIAAERGLSSFDQRHRFTADYSYELPFGKDRKWLKGDNWAAKTFSGFTWSGNLVIASGTPLSPRILGTSGDLSRGVSGSLRPDVVPGQSITAGDPTVSQWFNTLAFTSPAGVFGDAGRNIIPGPGTVSFDMSVSRNIQLKEMQALEFRISATNVFNSVHFTGIDTTLGSPTFGQVIATGPMRKIQLLTRYRF